MSLLKEKSFAFALRILKLSRFLGQRKLERPISHQILRAGTAPGAIITEAYFAESTADFIHKLSMARKEIAETQYWLELLYAIDMLTEAEFKSVKADADEIAKLLTATIKTKKRNISPKT
jgi:four helix bundle protein